MKLDIMTKYTETYTYILMQRFLVKIDWLCFMDIFNTGDTRSVEKSAECLAAAV